MRSCVCIASAALALTVASGPASAGKSCDGFDVVAHIFEMSDKDGSGSLSREEFDQAGLARYGVSFDAYDANGDGATSLDEYYEIYDRYHLAEGEIES